MFELFLSARRFFLLFSGISFSFVFSFCALNHPFRLCVSNYIDELFFVSFCVNTARSAAGMKDVNRLLWDGNLKSNSEYSTFPSAILLLKELPSFAPFSACKQLFFPSVAHQSILIFFQLFDVFLEQIKNFFPWRSNAICIFISVQLHDASRWCLRRNIFVDFWVSRRRQKFVCY